MIIRVSWLIPGLGAVFIGGILFLILNSGTPWEFSYQAPVFQKTFQLLAGFKEKFELALNQTFFPPTREMLLALILGERESLPYSFVESLNLTGTRHILAISGLHIGIIGGLLWFGLGILPFSLKARVFLSFIILGAYVLLIGAPPSALRATVMAGVFALGALAGRGIRSWHSLILAAVLLLAFEPAILGSLSFQLSFLAVAGILLLKPLMDNLLDFLPNPLKLRDLLSISLAVQIFLWPVLGFYFGRVALVAPLANLAIVPLLPYLIGGGFLSGFTGLVIPKFSLFFAWPVQKTGELGAGLLTALAGAPYSSVDLITPLWLVFGYYATLIGLVIWFNKSTKSKIQSSDVKDFR
jgi:competence protein ComEC